MYYLEANPSYADRADEVFAWLERAPHTAVTSLAHDDWLLVHPYSVGKEPLVDRLYALLFTRTSNG